MASIRLLTSSVALVLFAGCPVAPPETIYFVVSDPGGAHGDSYILPLTATGDIAHARALISDPDHTDAHIAVARIGRGAGDPPNRNVVGDGEAWSWHVTEFLGFADNTIEIYDGWPGYVEEHLDEWMDNTNGTIGFWNYTVTEELDLVEEQSNRCHTQTCLRVVQTSPHSNSIGAVLHFKACALSTEAHAWRDVATRFHPHTASARTRVPSSTRWSRA